MLTVTQTHWSPNMNPINETAQKAVNIVTDILSLTPDISKDHDEGTVTASWRNFGYGITATAVTERIDGIDHVNVSERLEFWVDVDGVDDNSFDGVEAEMERRYQKFMQLFAGMMPWVENVESPVV